MAARDDRPRSGDPSDHRLGCGYRPGGCRPRSGRPHRRPDHWSRCERIAFVLGQGERLPFPDATFDALTFTYLLRYVADPAATITELGRVVRPGGAMASLEFAVPQSPFWRGWWWLYTRAVLPVAGFALGGRPWLDVGRFLGPNITRHYRRFPVAATVGAWRAAGFTDVSLRRMSLGGGLVMWGRRTPDHRGGSPRP
jgi:demethylmenaquinone methyltransferase / 2-methoxy-6-polyprenyl-1,4-benzoquinol methylase